jgi:SAM-dependent methyltransferase
MNNRLAVGAVGSAALVGAAVLISRDRLGVAHANIRRYSMPGPASYDLAARLLFRDRYAAIATALAAEVPAGSRLLDVGCGPGEVLSNLATIAPEIETTGLDVDAAMIDRAERKANRLARLGSGRRPTFVVADAASMPFADGSFDVVVSSYAVHHWPDRHAGLAEMMRVLKPGGRAIIWDIAPPHSSETSEPDVHGDPHEGSAPHAAHRAGPGPAAGPSLFQTLRMLMIFRRIPSQRYDFTKPVA